MIDISNAKKRFMFNEQRRLYDAIPDDDTNRLAGVFGVDPKVISGFRKEVEDANESAIDSNEFRVLFRQFQGKSMKLMVVGDSNTSFRRSYINLIDHGMKDYQNIKIIDTSVPGLASMGVLDHLYDQVMIHEFDIALIMIGTNDVRRHGGDEGSTNCSLLEYKRNITEICSYIGRRVRHLIGINIPPICSVRMDENFGCNWGVSDDDIQAFNVEFSRAIEAQDGTCIDLYRMVEGATDESVLPDGLHIHPDVHVLISRKVLEVISQLNI